MSECINAGFGLTQELQHEWNSIEDLGMDIFQCPDNVLCSDREFWRVDADVLHSVETAKEAGMSMSLGFLVRIKGTGRLRT